MGVDEGKDTYSLAAIVESSFDTSGLDDVMCLALLRVWRNTVASLERSTELDKLFAAPVTSLWASTLPMMMRTTTSRRIFNR